MEFYAYTYTDPITLKPIYVGKGSGNRAYSHLYSTHNETLRGRIRILKEQDLKPIIKIYPCVDEEFALFLEEEMISLYGRKDKGIGSLFNHTDGNDGWAGRAFKGLPKSEEWKKKLSESKIGKSHPHKGRIDFKQSEETKNKIRNTLKGKPRPKVICENCGKYFTVGRIHYLHKNKCGGS